MTTIVNNPAPSSDNNGNNFGLLFGLIFLIVIVFLFFYYALPYIRGIGSGPQINVPSNVNVNLKQTK